MRRSLAAVLLAAIALATAACGSSRSGTAQSSGTVSSSRLILGGTVRCTATLTSPVPVGHELGLSIRFHNLTPHSVAVQPAYGGTWVAVKSADGTTYDTRIPLENSSGPPRGAIVLRAGASSTLRLEPGLRVRWAGPLHVTPGCDLSAAPPLRVAVTSPGPPVSSKAAVQEVVAAAGHLLDHCRPVSAGVAVVGQIDAPQHSAPPLRTRCSIALRPQSGFDLAQVLVTTTPQPRTVQLDELYEQFRSSPSGAGEMAAAWQFVVTKDGATPVAAAHVEHSRAGNGYAPDWNWSSAGPGPRSGDSICGSTGGGSGLGPVIEFVSVCR